MYGCVMRARKRWLLDGALLLAGLISLAYTSLHFIVPSQRFQQRLQAEVAKRSGYEIQPGDLRLIPPFRFVASAVVLSKSGHPLLQAERVSFTLSFFEHSAAGSSENQTHLRSELDRTGKIRLVDLRCSGKVHEKLMVLAGY